MRNVMIVVAVAVTAMFLFPLIASAEFYQYADDNGTTHFTDDPATIPKKYKKKKKTRDNDDDAGGTITKVNIIGNRVMVPVTVAYRGREVRGSFVLDTGATISTVSPAFAHRLDINARDADVAYAQGIGEGVHVVGHVKLDYFLVGPNRKYDMDVAVITAGNVDGLLGMNFLRELKYHVDFGSQTIRWGD